MLRITTTPDSISEDSYTIDTVTLDGQPINPDIDDIDLDPGIIYLDAHDDPTGWEHRADVALAANGYRRTGEWETHGSDVSAEITPAWTIRINADGTLINEARDWAARLVLNPAGKIVEVGSQPLDDTSYSRAEAAGINLSAPRLPNGLTPYDLVRALWDKADLLERIADGFSAYIGNDLKPHGRLTDDAETAYDALCQFIGGDLSEYASGDLWDASDWFADGGLTELKLGMTPEEVAELAERLTAEAWDHSNAVVNGIEAYLERTLNHMADEAEREAEEDGE